MRRAIALLALCAPFLCHAEPIESLQPMAFLAGHCWKGTMAEGKLSDEHCFEWLYEGKALRDRHVVRAPGRPDYQGETTYFWNSAAKKVEYLYIENAGGFSRGSVETEGTTLLFPSAQYTADGRTMNFRARWTRQGEDAYEAWSETQAGTGWSTMFRVRMQRTD